MNFTNPGSLYFLSLVPALLLLYMLKLRRKVLVVSSTLLWEQAFQDLKANTLFQRLRKNLLLPLQIIFLVSVIMALSGPFVRSSQYRAQEIVLIMDTSASMKSRDVDGERFQRAKQMALTQINSIAENDKITIIQAGVMPKILIGPSSDKKALSEVIKDLNASDTTCDMLSALKLANSVLRDNPKGQIVLLSDGAFEIKGDLSDLKAPVQLVKFGSNNFRNVAIVDSMLLKRESRLFVRLKDFSNKQGSPFNVELYNDDALVDLREVSLLPNEERVVDFNISSLNEGLIKVYVDVDDDLSVDNMTYHIFRPERPLKVILLGERNLFVEKAIEASNDGLQLRYSPSVDIKDGYDLLVLNGWSKIDVQRFETGTIIINPGLDLRFAESSSKKFEARVINWDKNHPIMRAVDLTELQIKEFYDYKMPSWMLPLSESDKGTILWCGEIKGKRFFVIPFDVTPAVSNNLALLPAFPILISNAINWASQESKPKTELKTGETFKAKILLRGQKGSVTVRKPDGKEVKLSAEDGVIIFDETDQVGTYRIIEHDIEFAVNLLNDDESNIQPRDKLKLPEEIVHEGQNIAQGKRELWKFFLANSVGMLLIEWWAYHRRVLV